MAFSADELRVLRRALAIALHPTPLAVEEVQDCLSLADSVDEAVREAGRLRAFLVDDLGRYRAALPGSAAGYLELLQDVLAAGYEPRAEDLAALRTLRATPAGALLLDRCQGLAEQSVRARLTRTPAPRTRLLALPGGRCADDKPKPAPKEPAPKQPAPAERPVPKPSEVFPPRRRPAPPPSEQLAAG
ncbi:hypothetical protein [Streptomyces purpureus]|uniref:Uncharacterized protein n=1 Tax=Streptomyces purpureus TaxID=1951 RepID=A0A918H6Y1_9ACTN|nr:hypothetical protein [Streptomyces purpureus]GGT37809.1 hypothetical protein GCM10014713_34330 [Streptomyces purpureus]